MSHRTPHEKQCVPLYSGEALWEWHIPTDKLFLSQGSCRALGLSSVGVPTTMTAFLAHIPPPCLPTLHELREGTLNGTAGSFLEATYPFDALLVRERLMILTRDMQGRATWAVGQFVVSATLLSYHPPQTSNPEGALTQAGVGYWHCSLRDRRVQLDARCTALLGFCDAQPRNMDMAEWKDRMHPEEGDSISCRHKLILEETLMGDALSDRLRIRREDGTYALMVLQGAVLERDETGKALFLVGNLQLVEMTNSVKNQPLQENGRLLFAINATGDGLWDWDAQTDSVYYSPRYLSMLGYTSDQFPGSLDVWKKKIHPDDHDKIVEPQRALVESPRYGDTFECTYRIQRADGTWGWILGRGYVTHRDANGRATRLVGMHTDVTTLQNGREELEALVKNDALTGLRSRTYCDMELERIEKNNIRPLSIISCDVCGLKLINDYMGHAVGDKLLSTAAIMLRYPLRAADCIARTGGDEFVILLPGCDEEKGKKILAQIEQHFEETNAVCDMPVLISFGIASTNDPSVPASKILIDADRNMIRHKQLLRKTVHRRVKDWIESNTSQAVSLEDDRYES